MYTRWSRLGLVLPLSALVFAPALAAKTVTAPYFHRTPRVMHRSGVRLTGTIRGIYSYLREVPDVGQGFTLVGSGRVFPLRNVQASGTFHTLGFMASGNARGRLTLRSPRGSIILALLGPKQRGSSPPPSSYRYTVTSASGTYRMTRGQGTVHLVLRGEMRQDASGEFVMTFRR